MSHQRIRTGTTRDSYLLPEVDFQASSAVRAGDLVFLGGATGLTIDGDDFVGRGNPAAQAENAMEVVRTLLEDVGASLDDICKVTTYVTDHASRNDVYSVLATHLTGVYPCSTGLVVPALAQPELDFEIDVFAVVAPEGRPHQRIRRFNKNTPQATDPSFPGLDLGLSRAVRAGNMLFLQGQTGRPIDNRTIEEGFVGRGDPVAQADTAMKNVAQLLDDAGSRMEDVCKVTVYVKDHAVRELVYPVLAEHLRGVNPVSTGLVVSQFGLPEVEFEIEVHAVIPSQLPRAGGGPSVTSHERIRPINTNTPEGRDPRFPKLDYGLSRAVRAGEVVYLQGQTGRTFDGGFVGEGDPAAQANQAMRNVKRLLDEAGARMEDICKITTYVKDHSYRELVYPVLADHLKGVFPCSTGVVVSTFGHPSVDFEIDVFAALNGDRA